jgi:hypothetical protein
MRVFKVRLEGNFFVFRSSYPIHNQALAEVEGYNLETQTRESKEYIDIFLHPTFHTSHLT